MNEDRRWLRLRRAAFAVYVPVLFAGTHWPKLEVPGTGRPDLLVHAAAFGLWTALLMACALFGPALSRRNIILAGFIGAAYASFDEATQAVPVLRRIAAWDDWVFNLAGVAIAVVAGAALRRLLAGREPGGAPAS